MRESSLVPTNLMEWPSVAALLPEQKFILERLWASGWIKSTGWGELHLLSLAASISMTPAATLSGIYHLRDAGLVVYDEETNEIFICNWFRFHKFRGVGVAIAKKEILKIRSTSIRSLILEKSSGCFPTTSSSSSSSEKAEDGMPADSKEESEILNQAFRLVQPFIKNEIDKQNWLNIKSKFSGAQILAAIHKVMDEGNMPYISSLQKVLKATASSPSNHKCQVSSCSKYASSRTSWGEWRCAQHI